MYSAIERKGTRDGLDRNDSLLDRNDGGLSGEERGSSWRDEMPD